MVQKCLFRSQAVTRSLTTDENLTAIIEVDDEITRRKTSTQVVSPGIRPPP